MGGIGAAVGGVGAAAGQAVSGLAGGAASQVAGFGASAVLGSITSWVVNAAQWLLSQVGTFLSSSTRPDLSAQWFTSHYKVMLGAAAVVVVPLLLVSAMQAVLRQDPAPLVRSALVHLPLAILLAAVAAELVQLGLAALDALSTSVASSAGNDVAKLLGDVAAALQAPAAGGEPGVPAFVILVSAILVVLASFALWLELVVRSAAIYVAVLFLPLALAGLVWPATLHWSKRLAETLVALVVSKLVIVAVLSLAGAALAEGKVGFDQVLAGTALLLLAAFSPFAVLRLIPAAESRAVSQLEGVSRRTAKSMHLPSLDTIDSMLLTAGAGSVGATEVPGAGIGMAEGIPFREWTGEDPDRGIDGGAGGGNAPLDPRGGGDPDGASGEDSPGLPSRPPATAVDAMGTEADRGAGGRVSLALGGAPAVPVGALSSREPQASSLPANGPLEQPSSASSRGALPPGSSSALPDRA